MATKYKLHKRIARGGMAEIYIATAHPDTGSAPRLCCVKRILPHYAHDKEFIQMFRDEAKICEKFIHPNLVEVSDFLKIDGAWAIVMELVAGVDLRALFAASERQNSRLTNGMICQIVRKAADGLHYAHEKVDPITGKRLGIVHRDISPQNILIGFDGSTKVTDFGIAEADSKLNETKPGIVKGKYSYMSPEQIMAKPVDQRTDVFALGIILWEALAMKRLFRGSNEVETIQLVKTCKITKDIREFNSSLDSTLYNIVMKALQKDPKERYQSAAEFSTDLKRYMKQVHSDFKPSRLSEFVVETMKEKHQEFLTNMESALADAGQYGSGWDQNSRMNNPASSQQKDSKYPKKEEKNNTNKASQNDGLKLALEKKEGSPFESPVNKPGSSEKTNKSEELTFEKLERGNISKPETHPGLSLAGKKNGNEKETSSFEEKNTKMNELHSKLNKRISSNKLKPSIREFPSSNSSSTRQFSRQSHVSGFEPKKSNRKSKISTKSNLTYVLALVGVFLVTSGGMLYHLKSRPTSQNVRIEFTPRRLLVSVDGNKIGKKYLKSPVHLKNIKLGLRTLEFERAGYEKTSVVANLDGKSETKNLTVALKRTQQMAPTEMILTKKTNTRELSYRFEQDMEIGKLTRGRKASVSDLPFGDLLKVTFFAPNKRSFTCEFVPFSKKWARPFLVIVDPEARSCKTRRPRL